MGEEGIEFTLMGSMQMLHLFRMLMDGFVFDYGGNEGNLGENVV